MPEDNEEGFVVRDRRRFVDQMNEPARTGAEESAPEKGAAAAPAAEPPAARAVASPAAPGRTSPAAAFAASGPAAPPPAPSLSDAAGAGPVQPFAGFADNRGGGGAAGDIFSGGPGGIYAPEDAGGFGDEFASPDGQEVPDVFSYLLEFLGILRAQALLRMGLIANPATGQPEPDLLQAQVAIDTCAFLAAQIEPVVAPEERLPLRAMISDLQVHFVEQSRRG